MRDNSHFAKRQRKDKMCMFQGERSSINYYVLVCAAVRQEVQGERKINGVFRATEI